MADDTVDDGPWVRSDDSLGDESSIPSIGVGSQKPPPPSSDDAMLIAVRQIRRELSQPVIGVVTSSKQRMSELLVWFQKRLPRARSLHLCAAEDGQLMLPEGYPLDHFHVLVLDHSSPAVCRWLAKSTTARSCPELVLVGLPHLDAANLRQRGLPVASEFRSPWRTGHIGKAVAHSLSLRLPLKLLSRRAVGRLALKDALALVRFYMVTEALWTTGSKRGSARLLGVTRPAVQNMMRSLSIQDPSDESNEELGASHLAPSSHLDAGFNRRS